MPNIKANYQQTEQGRSVTYTDEAGNQEVRIGGSRSWRNNNPGNLEYGDFAKKHEAIGTDGRFAIFPDEQTGRKAKEVLLNNNYNENSIREMLKGVYDKDGKLIKRGYAPKDDKNDPDQYADSIKKWTGIDVDKKKIKELTPDEMTKLLDAMKGREGWNPGKIIKLDPRGKPISRMDAPDQFSDPFRRNHPFVYGKPLKMNEEDDGRLV